MAKSVNLAKYDQGMLDLIEAVCETGKPCDVPYPDNGIAQKERFEFYGLVRALHVQNHSIAPKAKRLRFRIGGPSKNVLTITLGPDVTGDFYARIADNHLNK